MHSNDQTFTKKSLHSENRPWWHRPWAWAILGALLVLLGYLIGSCGRKPVADVAPDTSQEELLLKAQQGVNDGLQAEIDRLRALLAGDVCTSEPYAPLRDTPTPSETGPGQALPPPENMELPADPGGPKHFSVPTTNATIEPLQAPENLQKPETLAALAEQATVLVLATKGNDGQMGTGFFYAPRSGFDQRACGERLHRFLYHKQEPGQTAPGQSSCLW